MKESIKEGSDVHLVIEKENNSDKCHATSKNVKIERENQKSRIK
jgi:hypothetical protein